MVLGSPGLLPAPVIHFVESFSKGWIVYAWAPFPLRTDPSGHAHTGVSILFISQNNVLPLSSGQHVGASIACQCAGMDEKISWRDLTRKGIYWFQVKGRSG